MSSAPNDAAPGSSSKTDVVVKVAIPVITCAVAAITLYLTVLRDSDQSHDKKTELKQKEVDLFYKQSDIQRAKEAAKADFLQKNMSLLTSSQPGAMRQAEALIDATFTSPAEALDVKTKAQHIHESAAEPPPQAPNGTAQFKNLGFQYASGGYFAEAAFSFSNVVTLTPDDVQAWNALAYAQLRQGDTDGAFKSISRAIELKPTEANLVRVITLNAAKILCAQGKIDSARTYLNVAIGMNQQLLSAAKSDGELSRTCGFHFS
jgi:tetratricopeptide (TPR) repeat protein